MNLICPALLAGTHIPARSMNHAVPGGRDVSPALLWGVVPGGTKSYALCVRDQEPPASVLWFVVNLPPQTRELFEGASGVREKLPAGCLELRNAFGDLRYGGPIVRRGDEPHCIAFQLWALSVPKLDTGPFTAHEALLDMVGRAVIETATLEATATRTV
jgi:Raf kinase inhibitor-like YbhB/YbcL family protein